MTHSKTRSFTQHKLDETLRYQDPPPPPPDPPPEDPPPELLEDGLEDIADVAADIVEFINLPKTAALNVSYGSEL